MRPPETNPERNGRHPPLIRVIRLMGYFLAATVAWAAGAPSLEIRVLEGDAAAYAAGSRATRGITVLVSDGNGRPVEGATVSFSLPPNGPGGVFVSGSRTELVTTHTDGRAAVWGMQWNRTVGAFEMRIAAVKGEARGTIVSLQNLTPPDRAAAGARIQASRGGGHKLLWISLAAAGAAVAGVAGAGLSKSTSSSPAATSSTATTTIGAPSIILGHP